TMSDWGREVLVNQIGEPAGTDVVLAEVMALRAGFFLPWTAATPLTASPTPCLFFALAEWLTPMGSIHSLEL
ncbi:MAG TPA: hypothetical protein VE054_02320, partial [Blattabacteriaceae bacterium]|nr:hypothetical protein [Blattabacteriaceae bacterium]